MLGFKIWTVSSHLLVYRYVYLMFIGPCIILIVE